MSPRFDLLLVFIISHIITQLHPFWSTIFQFLRSQTDTQTNGLANWHTYKHNKNNTCTLMSNISVFTALHEMQTR